MSKAEERKTEIKKRKQAIDKMTAVMFAVIQRRLKNCHNKTSITIQTGPNGRHRYFTIKRDKQMIKVSIYNDGNVNVMLGEPVYGEIEIPMIRYEEVDNIDNVIAEMKGYVSLFFREFFEGSMHALVAYMSSCNIKTEWKACLNSYKEYYRIR